jgi:hypothetical protein
MWATANDRYINLAANFLLLGMFVVSESGFIDQGITDIQGTVASTNIRFGLWNDNSGRPGDLLWDSGNIAANAGSQTSTLSPTVSVIAGQILWTGFITSGTVGMLHTATATIHSFAQGQFGPTAACLRSDVTFGALTSNPTISANEGSGVPSIRWRLNP